MINSHCFNVRNLILVVMLSIGFGFIPSAFSQPHESFTIDPNGKVWTRLDYSGTNETKALGINNSGRVIGALIQYGGRWGPGVEHAFITGPNGMGIADLGTLGGIYPTADSRAYDFNESGQVVGESWTATGELHAFITGPNGVSMTDLGTLGGRHSRAFAINESGQVVGESTTATGELHAFITGPNGEGMKDLNSLVDLPDRVILAYAFAINDKGQVLTQTIPEPETYAMLLAGLGLVGFVVRRKKAENRVEHH